MQHRVTAMLLVTLVAVPAAFGDRAGDLASTAQPVGVRLAASGDTGQRVIFPRDGRTIQAERTERLGDRIRVETPTGRTEPPSSAGPKMRDADE